MRLRTVNRSSVSGYPVGTGWVVLDEIHKHTRWRQVVNGLFDTRRPEVSVLVTLGWIRQ